MCYEGASSNVSALGIWGDGDQEKRYWPKYYNVDVIEACLRDNEAEDIYSVCGDLEEHNYNMQCIKEAEYIMKLFINHVFLSKRCRKTPHTYKNRGETVTKRFCYPEPMDIHFLYCHQIDDHNHYRHQPIVLENAWRFFFGGWGLHIPIFCH